MAEGDGMGSAATVGKPEGLPASLPGPWDSGPWIPLERRRSPDRAIGSAKYSLYPRLRMARVTLAPPSIFPTEPPSQHCQLLAAQAAQGLGAGTVLGEGISFHVG